MPANAATNWFTPKPVIRMVENWFADRFFRFRKNWDYSGGIATDLFYHVAAPLNTVPGHKF